MLCAAQEAALQDRIKIRMNEGSCPFAPSLIQRRISVRSHTDNFFDPCGMRSSGLARQSRSHMRLLESGSPGMTIGPCFGPLHQPFIRSSDQGRIGRQIKAARLVALAARLVAIDATALEDRENILVEARGLPFLTACIDNQGGRTQASQRVRLGSSTDPLPNSLCGYVPGDPSTDRGGVITNVLNWWMAHPDVFDGHTIDGYVGSITPR